MALLQAVLQWFGNRQETLLHHPLSISLLLFSSLFLIHWLNGFPGEKPNLPPSPPKLPIIGHLHRLGTLPHRSLRALSKKYGPLMLLQLGYTPTVVVSSAEMGRQIMKTCDLIFSNRPITTASKAFHYGCKDVAFAPYGEYWRQVRKICVLDLLSAKRVQSFRSVREEEIANMVNKIKQACSMGTFVNLSDLIVTITNDVISRTALGRKLEIEEGKSEYAELTKEVMKLFGGFSVEDMFPSLGWIDVLTGLDKRMKKTSKAMHQFLDEVIDEHLMARKDGDGQSERRDFVDILLDCQMDSTLAVEITGENLKAIILDIFVAGTDTTFTTLEWAMAELVNHPNVMNKVQEEIRQVVGTKCEVDEDDIYQMEYLNCVIKETLRLHPPLVLSLPRVANTSTSIEGYHIPAKTRIIINAWAIARDPKIWDRPEEFVPERFMNNPVDFRGQDFEFIPFGAGRRGCPGISFAITSVESVLANLLHFFDWELPHGVENKGGLDMTEAFGLSVHLQVPLHLVPISHCV